MALDDNGRKELYRKLLNDPATSAGTKKYSFTQWERKIAESPNALAKIGAYAISKKWANDLEDFSNRYGAGAKPYTPPPAPKPQAAPVAPVPIEQEPYVPEPQPAIGSPEYDAQLQAQYGGMSPTLGATFGGVPAAFETKAQKKQEQISPAFKAQQLAFEDVPIASEQRRAQREFAKATKEQQQAAIRGGTGAELKKYRQAESEGVGDRAAANVEALWEGAKNAGAQIFNGLKAVMNAAALNETPMDEDEREYYQQQEFGKMYEASKEAENNFQDELYRLNVSNDVLKAVDEGNYSKVPEAILQTIGNIGVSAISSLLTGGGSMYYQTLPEQYRDGVEAIAREKGITPEEVIRSGEDAKMTAQTVGGIVSALERAGAGRLSKSIMNKGGYKAVRDFLIRNGFGKNVGRVGGLGYAGSGEFATEYAQQGAQQLGRIAAASEDASQFFKKLPKEFLSEEAFKERFGAGVGGFVGGAGVVGLGRGLKKSLGGGISLDRFSEEISNNELIQNAANGYEDNIARAEEQGRKPNSFYQKQLKKIISDPEAWVKDEIKYLKQTIEGNKKANIDSKVEENSLAKANSLLNQIKAEKKAIEEADIASAEQPVATQETEVAAPEAAVAPLVAPEVAPVAEEVITEEIIPVEEDEDLAALNEQIAAIEGAPAEREMVPATPEVRFELPKLDVTLPEGFAPALRKLGYTDEEISGMTIEQQQDIVINKTEPARAAGESKVDVAKENQRVERVAEAQRKIDEEIAAEDAALAAPVAQAEEVVAAAPATPAPKAKKAPAPKAEIARPSRDSFPESQSNTRTPVTQKLLDYFADVSGIPRFTDDLSKGTYIGWLQNANATGYEVASKLNAPRQAFDIIAQAEKERSEAAAPAPKAETKQEAPKPEPKKEEPSKGEKATIELNRQKELKNITAALQGVRGELNVNIAGRGRKADVTANIGQGFTDIQTIELNESEKQEAIEQYRLLDDKDLTQIEFNKWMKDFGKRVLQRISNEINAKYDAALRGEPIAETKTEAVVKGEVKPTDQPQMDTKSNPKLKHDPSIKERGDFKIGDEAQWRSSDPKNKAKGTVVGFTPDDYYNVFLKLSTPYNDGWGWHKAGDIVLVQGAFLNNLRLQAEQKVKEEQSIDDVKSKKFREAFEERFGGVNGLSYDAVNTALRDLPEDASGKQFLEIADGVKESDKKLAAATTKMLFNKMRFDPDFNDERELIKTNRKAAIDSLKWMAENGLPIPRDLAKEAGIKITPAPEAKEGKKAEAKGEKPTAAVLEKDIVSTKIKEIAEKFKSIESELQGEIDVQDFSDRLRKRYEEIKSQYGEAKANEVLKSESNRADKIIKESRDGILKRLKGEYFEKNGFAPSSIKEFQKGIDSGEYKIDGLPSYKDAVSAKIVEEAVPPVPSFTSEQSSEAATAFDKAKTSKGFDKKHGKGAYKALSDITKNFEDIMDNLSDKIKQDCL
jgi:hypothetical protein